MDHGDFTNKIDALFMTQDMNKRGKEFYIPSATKEVRDRLMYNLLKTYQEKNNGK